MELPRVIPCLLLRRGALVKTQRFKNAEYVGDPINTVRIYNEQGADELIFLDTAGRFAVHEKDSPAAPVWENFLRHLKRFRPRRPRRAGVPGSP